MPTILVMEPDDKLRFLLRFKLEKHGYSVLEASSSAQVAAMLQRCTPDLLITEIETEETVLLLAGLVLHSPTMPIIITLSNSSYGGLNPDALMDDVKARFIKPYDPLDVLAVCFTLLRTQSAERLSL